MNSLNAQEKARLQKLQNLQEARTLSVSEASEWHALVERVEREEMERLAPSLARKDAENARAAERIRALNALIERKAALVARLEKLLGEVQAERAAIDQEVANITADKGSLAEISA